MNGARQNGKRNAVTERERERVTEEKRYFFRERSQGSDIMEHNLGGGCVCVRYVCVCVCAPLRERELV